MPFEQISSDESPARRLMGPARAAIALVFVCCSALLLYGIPRGIDLTDESFYLIWVRNPEAYRLLYQPFGYVLHPVWIWTGESLGLFRLAGLFANLASGLLLGIAIARFYSARFPGTLKESGSLPLLGALTTLAGYYFWILTPSYNMLGNMGAQLILAGALGWLGHPTSRAQDALWSALLGVGGCLALFGKPILAALAAVAVIALLVAVRREGRSLVRGVIAAAVAVAMTLSALAPFVGPMELVGRILASQEILALNNSLGRLPMKTLGDLYRAPPVLFASTTAFVLVLASMRHESPPTALKWALRGLLAACFLFALGHLVAGVRNGTLPAYVGVSAASTLLTAIAIGASSGKVCRRALIVPGVLVVVPFAVALGTFNNLAAQISMSLPFLLLGIALLGSMVGISSWFLVGSVVAVPAVLTVAALFPYGLPTSVFAQAQQVRIQALQTQLQVDPLTKNYVEKFSATTVPRSAALIDLSGGGPGTALLMGRSPPVLPWISQITPHWADVVWERLEEEDRQCAWLIGPIHPFFQTTAAAHDISSRQYSAVTSANMKVGSAIQRIILFKPRHPIGACASRLEPSMIPRAKGGFHSVVINDPPPCCGSETIGCTPARC